MAVLYAAMLRELPSDGAQVRPLVAARVRCAVLAGRYSLRGAELGLDSDEGRAAVELALRLDQRAERLAVTALDISTRLAARDENRIDVDAIDAEFASELLTRTPPRGGRASSDSEGGAQIFHGDPAKDNGGCAT